VPTAGLACLLLDRQPTTGTALSLSSAGIADVANAGMFAKCAKLDGSGNERLAA